MSPEADRNPDVVTWPPSGRESSTCSPGLFGATVASPIYGAAEELVMTIAGIALLGTMSSFSLGRRLQGEKERDAALIRSWSRLGLAAPG